MCLQNFFVELICQVMVCRTEDPLLSEQFLVRELEPFWC